MHDLYDKDYVIDTLSLLWDEINNLNKWSAYNEDKGNEEIHALREAFERVKEAVKGGETTK